MSLVTFRQMKVGDWNEVSEIYRQGITTGDATFEIKVPSWKDWDTSHLQECRIVAVLEEEVIGWAALTPVSGRCVYAGVGEVSVYVAAKSMGRGTGTALLERLIEESEKASIWTLQAGVFKENKASIKAHLNAGFREVGYREKVGKMNGVWRDTILLERRSKVVGID